MATIKKSQLKGCACSKPSQLFEIDVPILTKHINEISSNTGLKSNQRYANIGILYLESKELIVSGSFGSGRLTVKCRKKDCKDSLDKLEKVLMNLKK